MNTARPTRRPSNAPTTKRNTPTKRARNSKRSARRARRRARSGAKAAGEIKPTPTQEENDLAASGVHIEEHEADGSGPDPNSPEAREAKTKDKHLEADKPAGGYQTRTAPAKA